MLVLCFVQWWYGRGFKEYLNKFTDHLKDTVDFFSMHLLIRNFFEPYRQIGTGRRDNLPLEDRFHAWVDLALSRFIGATSRFVILVVGTILLIIRTVIGGVLMILWPLAPALIVCLVILYMNGVTFL